MNRKFATGTPKRPHLRPDPRLFRARLARSREQPGATLRAVSAPNDLTVEATVVAVQLAPPVADLPPGEPKDNLVLASAYADGAGIRVQFGPINGPDQPVGFMPGDSVVLNVDETQIGPITLENVDPDDVFSDLKPDPVEFVVMNDAFGPTGEYRSSSMQYQWIFTEGATRGPMQKISVDNVAPAPDASFPGKLRFSPDIERNGITPQSFLKDDDGNEYIPAEVPGYLGKKAGDAIHGYIDSKVDPDEEDIGLVEYGDSSTFVTVRFPRAFIEAGGDGVKQFQYNIKGREGLISALSDPILISVLIEDFIGDLEEPEVPAYDNDTPDEELINEQDARDNLEVVIPANAAIQAGDSIQLHWGAVTAPLVTVADPADIRIVLSYAIVLAAWLAGNASGDDMQLPAEVSYDVYRGLLKVGTSPAHHVEVNLHTAGGGIDPEPGTEPNENLLAPVLRPNSGASNDDRIPVEDSGKDATVRIDKLGKNGEEIFAAGDRVVVHYATEVLAAYPVVAEDLADTALPLEITLPSAVIDAVGAGLRNLSYWIERDLANGGFNTTKSPTKDVVVETADALPGAGTLQVVVMPELINGSSLGLRSMLDGTPIAIPEYANFTEDDDIVLYVPIYPSRHEAGEVPVPGYGAAPGDADQGNRFLLPKPHVMLDAEVGNQTEPGGNGANPTRPPITVPHIFFRLPVERIPGLHGLSTYHTHITYEVTNDIGAVTSSVKGILIDPRGSDSAPAAASAVNGRGAAAESVHSLLERLRALAAAIERFFG
jgi:hypothetical protein